METLLSNIGIKLLLHLTLVNFCKSGAEMMKTRCFLFFSFFIRLHSYKKKSLCPSCFGCHHNILL